MTQVHDSGHLVTIIMCPSTYPQTASHFLTGISPYEHHYSVNILKSTQETSSLPKLLYFTLPEERVTLSSHV